MIDPAARRRNSRRMVFDLIRERQKLSGLSWPEKQT